MTKRRLASYGLNLVGVAMLYALITLPYTFSPTFLPRMPEGLTSRMTIRVP